MIFRGEEQSSHTCEITQERAESHTICNVDRLKLFKCVRVCVCVYARARARANVYVCVCACKALVHETHSHLVY